MSDARKVLSFRHSSEVAYLACNPTAKWVWHGKPAGKREGSASSSRSSRWGSSRVPTFFTWCGQIGAPKVFDYSLFWRPRFGLGRRPAYCDFRTTSLVPMLYGPIVPFVAAHLSHVFGHGAVAALAAGRSITILSTLMVCALVLAFANTRREQAVFCDSRFGIHDLASGSVVGLRVSR